MKPIEDLVAQVRQIAYDIHVYQAHGHLEKVYENALTHRLSLAGLDVKQQHPIQVHDEDVTVIGEYFADLIVEDRLLIELKATKPPSDEHIAQVLGYLKSTRLDHGMLINFGSYKFQVRKFIRSSSLFPVASLLAPFFALSVFFAAKF
jgi:GxxExxY protein